MSTPALEPVVTKAARRLMPFLALLFLYLGARSPSATTVLLIVAATVFRCVLVVGLIARPTMAKPNPLRFIGALGTYATGAALCGTLLR